MARMHFHPMERNGMRFINSKFKGLEHHNWRNVEDNSNNEKVNEKVSEKVTQVENPSGIKQALAYLANRFGEETSIHGFNRLLRTRTGKYERYQVKTILRIQENF